MKLNNLKNQTPTGFFISVLKLFKYHILWCCACFAVSLIFRKYIIAECFSQLLDLVKTSSKNLGFGNKGYLYYSILLLGSSIISVLCVFLGEYSIGIVRARIEKKIRIELFDMVQRYDMSFFHHSRGEGFLENSIDCIVESVSNMTDVLFTKTFPEILLTIAILVNFFQVKKLLCVSSMGILLVCSYLYLLTNQITTDILEEHTQIASQRTNKMIDSFKNQFVKRIFGLETVEKKNLDSIHKRETKLLIDAGIYGAYIDVSLYLVLQVFYKSMFIFFLIYIYIDDISKNFSLFFTLLQYNFSLISCVSSLFEEISEIRHEIGQFKRSFNILKQGVQESNENHLAINKKTFKGAIEIKNIDFNYGNKTIFSDFSMKIPAFSSLAIVGSSGVGKSTLLNLLCKIQKPSKGTIYIDNMDISTLDTHSLRKQIAYITQSNMLFNDTIYNNIAYGNLNATKDDIIAAAKKAELHDTIMQLPDQYESYVGISGSNLSGGQIQRICIARAMLRVKNGHNIILCDEPISSVDKVTASQLTKTILNISRDHTTIIIDHSMYIPPVVDQVLFLHSKNGHSYLLGSHEELLERSELYKNLFFHQINLESPN